MTTFEELKKVGHLSPDQYAALLELEKWCASFRQNRSWRGERDMWFLVEFLRLWDLCENTRRRGHQCPEGCPRCQVCSGEYLIANREEDDSE